MPTFTFNPITGQLDIVSVTSTGSSSIFLLEDGTDRLLLENDTDTLGLEA